MKDLGASLLAVLVCSGCGGDVRTSRTGDAGASGGASTGGGPSSGGAPAGGHSGNGGTPTTGGSPSTGGSAGGCGGQCAGPFTYFNYGFTCCGAVCVQQDNDPHHCGGCDTVCPASAPLCSHRQCIVPTCGNPYVPDAGPTVCATGTTCCGTECCTAGQLCCDPDWGGTVAMPIGCSNPSESGTCPVGCPQCVCASPDTPIATPNGDRAIATLAVGDLVYSVDHDQVIEVPIVEAYRNAARSHHVVRVELEGGSVLEISAPHPTANGRRFGDLHRGDVLDGKRILSATVIPYSYAFTYDILPASDSGAYFAAGTLIGSTLGGSALSLAEGKHDLAP